MAELALLNPIELSQWRQRISSQPYEWRVYEAGAVATSLTAVTGHDGIQRQLRTRDLVGWRATGFGSPETAIKAAEMHGPGAYLVALFTMRPFGGWKGQIAAVFTVRADGETVMRLE